MTTGKVTIPTDSHCLFNRLQNKYDYLLPAPINLPINLMKAWRRCDKCLRGCSTSCAVMAYPASGDSDDRRRPYSSMVKPTFSDTCHCATSPFSIAPRHSVT